MSETPKKYLLAAFTACLFFCASCVEEIDQFIVSDVIIKGEIAQMMAELEKTPRSESFRAESDFIMVLDKAIISIPAGSFANSSGAPIEEGELQIQVREIYEKSEMIRHDIPTVTEDRLIESDGVFEIKVFRDGEEVELAGGKTINIKIENNAPREQMELFYGDEVNGDFVWREADSDPETWSNVWQSQWTIDTDSMVLSGFGYEMEVEQLDWINCDIFNNEQPTTTVCIDLPPGYDSSNSRAFMVFNDISSISPLQADPDKEMFCTNYAPVPLEREVSLLVLSALDGTYYASKRSEIIVPDLTVSMQPQKMELQEIEELIDNL